MLTHVLSEAPGSGGHVPGARQRQRMYFTHIEIHITRI
jgi:hypothetical protein